MKNTVKITVKIIAIIALAMSALSLFACKTKIDYFSYVSDLRKDVFVGENELFGVTVWAGARETPYASDGIRNETSLNLTIKVVCKKETGDKITATVAYNENEYTRDLSFHPVKSAMSTSFDVKVLPEKQLTVKLDYGEESSTLTLDSALSDDTVPYTVALEKAADHCADFINRHTEKGNLKAEISVRLLAENGNNYYYVGFTATDGEKKTVLIDGENGSVLAEKDN